MSRTYTNELPLAVPGGEEPDSYVDVDRDVRKLKRLKRWIWIYFWLLLFEGALRKWALPALSGPLLIIRDPVVLIIYYYAYRCGKLSMKRFWPFAVLAGTLGLLGCAQIVNGTVTLPIVLYGLRSYALHPALIFVMAETLDDEDIYQFGRRVLLLSIPLFALVLLQFNASGSSWLNAGAGEGSAQIIAARGHVRPAGPFSYGVGMQSYEVLLMAFLLDAVMRKGRYPAWLLYSALFSAVAMIPLLGSRTVLFMVAIFGLFTILSGLSRGARLVGFTRIIAMLLLAACIAVQFQFFQEALATFEQRWTEAEHSEGGSIEGIFQARVLAMFESSGRFAFSVPWLGKGVGIGSNFAAATLTGEETFLAGESEWERVVYEFGPPIGLLFMGARVAFALYITLQAFKALKGYSVLAWLLVPVVVPLVLLTIMEQATYLGFMVFGTGLCLAAARIEQKAIWQTSLYPERSF